MTCKNFETFCRDEIIEMMNFCNTVQIEEISRISDLAPDIVSLQNVPINAEELISIPGYESIFFASQYSDFGVVTLWNPGKLTMVKSFKFDFYVKNQNPSDSSGLILMLHSHNKHRICVANCNLGEDYQKSRVYMYFVLRKLNELKAQADQLIIFGVSNEFYKLLCVDGDFSSYNKSVIDQLNRVVSKEKDKTLKVYLGNGGKFNEIFRFNLLKVEKTGSRWAYYIGRLSLRYQNEVFYIESRK